MANTRQRTEVIVGSFVLLGLGFLGVLLFQFGGVGRGVGDAYPLIVLVRDASGVQKGAPVRLGGVEIGYVGGEPELDESFASLRLILRIFPDSRVPKESEIRIGASGLLGDGFVRIIPPAKPSGAFYEGGDVIEAKGSSSMDDLATGATDTLADAGQVLGEVAESIRQLNETFARFDKGVLNEKNIENLSVVLEDLRASSARVEVASRRLDPVLAETEKAATGVQSAAESANKMFEHLNGEISGMSSSLETFTPVLKEFDTTLDELRLTLAAANGLMNRIENGGGLAGALLHDAELRADLSSFLDKLDRSGVLFYPREDGPLRRNNRKPSDSTSNQRSNRDTDKETEKKGLFQWLKKKP